MMTGKWLAVFFISFGVLLSGCEKGDGDKTAAPDQNSSIVGENNGQNAVTTGTTESTPSQATPPPPIATPIVKYTPSKAYPGYTTETYSSSELIALPYDGFKTKATGEAIFKNEIIIESLELSVQGKDVKFVAKGTMTEDVSEKYYFMVQMVQNGISIENLEHAFKPKVEKDENAGIYRFVDEGRITARNPIALGTIDGFLIAFRDMETNKMLKTKSTSLGFIDRSDSYNGMAIFWPLEKKEVE